MIKLVILSPEWSKTVEDVEAVFLPGALGEFEVLVNHAPIISILTEGTIRARKTGGALETFAIRGGVASLENNLLKICVEE